MTSKSFETQSFETLLKSKNHSIRAYYEVLEALAQNPNISADTLKSLVENYKDKTEAGAISILQAAANSKNINKETMKLLATSHEYVRIALARSDRFSKNNKKEGANAGELESIGDKAQNTTRESLESNYENACEECDAYLKDISKDNVEENKKKESTREKERGSRKEKKERAEYDQATEDILKILANDTCYEVRKLVLNSPKINADIVHTLASVSSDSEYLLEKIAKYEQTYENTLKIIIDYEVSKASKAILIAAMAIEIWEKSYLKVLLKNATKAFLKIRIFSKPWLVALSYVLIN